MNYTLEDCNRISQQRKGDCLSDAYVNDETELNFKCSIGHLFSLSPYDVVKLWKWCSKCEDHTIWNLNRIRDYAKSKSGECLSNIYVDYDSYLDWECREKHVWSATLHNVIGGYWCGVCEKRRPRVLTIDDMEKVGEDYGHMCLSDEYKNAHEELYFQCAYGHFWSTNAMNIRKSNRGVHCPKCDLGSKLNDICKLAYDNGGRCLAVEYVHCDEKLEWECQKKHKFSMTTSKVKLGYWCQVCNDKGKSSKQLDKLQAIANDKGGVCLSTEYINGDTPMEWRCKQDHTWKTTSKNIMRNLWCSTCAKSGSVNTKCHNFYIKMQNIAKEKGGRCTSDKYINSTTKLDWICEKGHEFSLSPRYVENWCKLCKKNNKQL